MPVVYGQADTTPLVFIIFFLFFGTSWNINVTHGQLQQSLAGQWTIQAQGENKTYQATVPGGVYMALYKNKVISDPYAGFNDVAYREIGKKNWTFTKILNVTNAMINNDNVVLVCMGLDTIAQISINGNIIGNTSNMFVRYVFDVKKYITVGKNELKIAFTSPVTAALIASKKVPYNIPPNCPSSKQNGECHINMLRKMQASFSWDWGPAFPTQAIWRAIYLDSFNSAVIRDVTTRAFKGEHGGWSLEVEVFFQKSSVNSSVAGKLAIHLSALKIMLTIDLNLNDIVSKKTLIKIPKNVVVVPWWPHGYGKPYLYPLNVIYTSADGQELSAKQIYVGFRTVELVQQCVSRKQSDGLSFYFKINGVPIFFKGSNWIPADSFQERVTPQRIRNLLGSLVDANQNAIRVWGGGVYESDEFYKIADELGIMIWHDFMFAVALYPATPDFLESVSEEITYQVRRLMHHPSIIIWAGNNENELAIRNTWFPMGLHYKRYHVDYIKLYVTTIMNIVAKEDQSRPYVTSSPSNGAKTKRDSWISPNPMNPRYGDIHHYDYISDLWVDANIPVPRFASEYGIQSWCSFPSLLSVFNQTKLAYWSKFTMDRQHHYAGQLEMEAEIIQHFDLPPSSRKMRPKKFQNMIYLTQINQAMAMRFETESYRRHQSEVVNGLGLTMGALYWQLNDIWQAPTWSSIEYDGTWKMLHYFSKKFFAPTLISPYFDSKNVLNINLVVDGIPVKEQQRNGSLQLVPYLDPKSKWAHVLTGNLRVQLYRWKSRRPVQTWSKKYNVDKTSEVVYKIPLADILKNKKCQPKSSCFLFFYTDSGSTSWLPLDRFKPATGIPFARIKVYNVEVVPKQKGIFKISLKSSDIAPFVWLEAAGISGRFSDNGFLMISKRKVIKFYTWKMVELTKFKAALTVKSLMDVYAK